MNFKCVELNKKTENYIFVFIISASILLSILYSLYTPTFESPDEQWHFMYASELAHRNHDGDISDYLSRSNPLYYYILSIPLQLWDYEKIEAIQNPDYPNDVHKFLHSYNEQFPFEGNAQIVHSLRLISILAGLTTIIFVYKITQKLFPHDKTIQLFTLTMAVLIPQFHFLTSQIYNGVFIYMFATITIFYLIKFSTNLHNKRFLLYAGIFSGLAFLTKNSGLILPVVTIILLTYFLVSKQLSIKHFFKNYSVYLCGCIVGGLWYVIYLFILFPYDFSKFNLISFFKHLRVPSLHSFETSNSVSIDGINRLNDWLSINFHGVYPYKNFEEINLHTFDQLWSVLGWFTIYSPKELVIVAHFISLFAISGLIILLVNRKSISKDLKKNHIVLLIISIFVTFSFLLLNVYSGYGAPIRYTFIVFSAGIILYSIGLYSISKKINLRYFLLIPIILLVSLNISLLYTMNDHFDHGFKPLNSIDPFHNILTMYEYRNGLQQKFPEVRDGDLTNLYDWAKNHGIYESPLLMYEKPIITLLQFYYHDVSLQKEFPEVKDRNINRLVKWAANKGYLENDELNEYRDFYLKFSLS